MEWEMVVVSLAAALCLAGCVELGVLQIVCCGLCGLDCVKWNWAVTCSPDAQNSDADALLRYIQT